MFLQGQESTMGSRAAMYKLLGQMLTESPPQLLPACLPDPGARSTSWIS